jgi:TetR/AcrR family transcriptional regulator
VTTASSNKPSRPRGRPPTSQGPAVTRKELLEIAAQAIGARGFDRASIRAIADAAGVSNRTVQHHFPTKDDLWRALVDEVVVPELAKRLSAEPSDVPATVEDEVGKRIERSITRPGLSAAIVTDPTEGARGRLEYLASAITETRGHNVETLRALMEVGALRQMDPRSLLITMSIGLTCISSAKTAIDVLYGVDLDDPAQRSGLTQDITELLLYGLLPRSN